MGERDTHFLGFARLLLSDLDAYQALRMDIVASEIETVIAQATYDLVAHVIEKTDYDTLDIHTIEEVIMDIPDLTEWPNTNTPIEQPTSTTEELLTVHEVALRLRLDDTTIRRYILDGILDAITLPHAGKRRIYRIRKSTIDRLLKVENTAT